MGSRTEKRVSSGFSLYDDEDDTPDVKRSKDDVIDNGTDRVDSSSLDSTTEEQRQQTITAPSDCVLDGFVPFLSVLSARKGERDDMQDAHLMIDKFTVDIIGHCALYGIYDGHAGSRAASYCEKLLPDILKKKLSSFPEVSTAEKSLKKVFIETYKSIDDAFLKDARKEKPVWKDGTTATTALILNKAIYVANIGDSRAVVCRVRADGRSLSAVQLTVDHNPTVYEERMRIQKAGGVVKDGRINGVIEVSRSIGDGQFKTAGVTCIPDMKKLTITPNDRFMIIACDGLWKSFSNEESIQFVDEQLKLDNKDEDCVDDEAVWKRVAGRLASTAVERRCGDNVSVILVRLHKKG